jgi:hypothetical protein
VLGEKIVGDEAESKTLVTMEDVKNVRDFFDHFKIEMPQYLTDHLAAMENAENIDEKLHDEMRVQVARAIAESEHEIFKDQLFEEVIPNCQKAWFDRQFSEDFEEAMDPTP